MLAHPYLDFAAASDVVCMTVCVGSLCQLQPHLIKDLQVTLHLQQATHVCSSKVCTVVSEAGM
jgi:hypothetical protein